MRRSQCHAMHGSYITLSQFGRFVTLYVSVPLALWWHSRVSDSVSAVVVDGVFLADPPQPPPLLSIKVLELLLVPPPLTLGGTKLGFDGGLAAVDVEAPVRGDERGLGPIGLFQPTPGGPVVCVPQAGVELHGLVKWEFHTQIFAVFEHPDRYVVHQESGIA